MKKKIAWFLFFCMVTWMVANDLWGHYTRGKEVWFFGLGVWAGWVLLIGMFYAALDNLCAAFGVQIVILSKKEKKGS